LRTTKIVLNILRFITASTLIPPKYQILSYFNPEPILPQTNASNTYISGLQKDLSPKLNVLAKAILAVLKVGRG
jgi:hypothetical protein